MSTGLVVLCCSCVSFCCGMSEGTGNDSGSIWLNAVGGFLAADSGESKAVSDKRVDVDAAGKEVELLSEKTKKWLKANNAKLGEKYKRDITLNQKEDGYRGIWYENTKTPGEYVFKYSGGLGTYCAKHRPFAIYCPEVDKTFFCYGGTRQGENRALVHMVSYYDHGTGMVPRPTLLLDKETSDAHDNPVISVDDEGYVWIFSTAHGTGRPSYIHKSSKPYSIDRFELISPDIQRFADEAKEPFINFSYFQVWNVPGKGFSCFLTLYNQPVQRATYFVFSGDGVQWEVPVCIGAMGRGSYQVSFANESKAGTAFNYHPSEEGINFRTNVYYVETGDLGKTWVNAAGEKVDLPLREPKNNALVYDAESEKRSVYVKDLAFDKNGDPVILVVTSGGWRCGPGNNPRTWTVVRWDGGGWKISKAFDSDNNYDTGSIFIEDEIWRIIGPSVVGPQGYNPGGEMMLWESVNQGQNWNRVKQMTVNSPRNHNYARGVVNAHPDFCAIWADGHGREESISNLYFCNRAGEVYLLPRKMERDFEKPAKVELGKIIE
ncbi:MAG: BNR-4 repeat-containing protein [Sedimentisphaerales bacterium]|nr:BNR-4 repeat-containing protein [Sedimentisphaerales bacterium]